MLGTQLYMRHSLFHLLYPEAWSLLGETGKTELWWSLVSVVTGENIRYY